MRHMLSNDPAPLSKRLGWQLLLNDPTPASTKFGWRTLSESQSPRTSLLNASATLSRLLGLPVLLQDRPKAR